MGNYMACASSIPTAVPNIQPTHNHTHILTVMHANGMVEEFERPMVVAELMLQNPQNFVWDSSSLNSTRRAPAMPADATLQLGHLYYLLPSLAAAAKLPPHHKNKSVKGLFYGATLDVTNSETTIQAFEIKQKGDVTQVTVSAEYLKELMRCNAADGEEREGCDISELELAYRRHLMANRCSWKPKLETVLEMGLYQ